MPDEIEIMDDAPKAPEPKTVPEMVLMVGRLDREYKQYAALKDAAYQNLAAAKDRLLAAMAEHGIKTAEAGEFKATRTVRKAVPKIVDELAAISWLPRFAEQNPGIKPEHYLKLDKRGFGDLAKSLLKETGEVPDGVQLEDSEYVSVREDKS